MIKNEHWEILPNINTLVLSESIHEYYWPFVGLSKLQMNQKKSQNKKKWVIESHLRSMGKCSNILHSLKRISQSGHTDY